MHARGRIAIRHVDRPGRAKRHVGRVIEWRQWAIALADAAEPLPIRRADDALGGLTIDHEQAAVRRRYDHVGIDDQVRHLESSGLCCVRESDIATGRTPWRSTPMTAPTRSSPKRPLMRALMSD